MTPLPLYLPESACQSEIYRSHVICEKELGRKKKTKEENQTPGSHTHKHVTLLFRVIVHYDNCIVTLPNKTL